MTIDGSWRVTLAAGSGITVYGNAYAIYGNVYAIAGHCVEWARGAWLMR